jgi:hypothetical protein
MRRVDLSLKCGDRNLAWFVADGISRVYHKVHHDLLKLCRVGEHGGKTVVELEFQSGVLVNGHPEERGRGTHEFGDVHRLSAKVRFSSVREHLPAEIRSAASGLLNII